MASTCRYVRQNGRRRRFVRDARTAAFRRRFFPVGAPTRVVLISAKFFRKPLLSPPRKVPPPPAPETRKRRRTASRCGRGGPEFGRLRRLRVCNNDLSTSASSADGPRGARLRARRRGVRGLCCTNYPITHSKRFTTNRRIGTPIPPVSLYFIVKQFYDDGLLVIPSHVGFTLQCVCISHLNSNKTHIFLIE